MEEEMKFLSKVITAVILLALMLAIVPSATQSAQAATCYWAQFVADVTVPDGTNYAPNTAFTKTWRLKNIGTCAWNSNDVSLIFASGEQMGAPASSALPVTVNPGQTVDITVNMTAPSVAKNYFGFYKFKSAQGGEFGIGSNANKSFWVEINVTASAGTGFDFTEKAAEAKWTSGNGTNALTFPGTDGSANGFALKKDKPKLENGAELAQAGLLFVPNNVNNGDIQAEYKPFKVQTGDQFQATIGCEYGATTCYVAYRLDYKIGSGAVKTFWTFREKYEGLSYNVKLNLNSFAGQDVTFILVTSAYGSPSGDRAMWVAPIISRAGGVVATNTPTPLTGTPPTPTPTGSATSVPAACDRAQFVKDVTVPDGQTFQPGATFSKTWRLKNIGTCTWTGYSLLFDTGEKMSGPDSAVIPTSVAPGQTVDITVNLTAPSAVNTKPYRGYWKLKSNSNVPFGIGTGGTKSFWVEIKVAGTAVTPVVSVTPGTPVTPATPISGTVYDFAAHACEAKWFSLAGEQPCPGTEGAQNGFVLVTNPSKLENGTIDNRAGLLTYPQNINNGYIQGIYPSYKVKAGDKFRTIVNCEAGATSCYVVFKLEYALNGDSKVLTQWAFVEKYEGQYFNTADVGDISLSNLVGQDVKFILSVYATGSPSGDRALWVAPMIYNSGSGSVPATIAVTATNTPVPTTVTPLPVTATTTVTPLPVTETPTLIVPTATAIVTATPTVTLTPIP